MIRKSYVALGKSASITVALMGAGGLAALTPAAVLAVSSRLFTTSGQALIAVAIGTGAFLSAVVGAAVLESRLADPDIREKTFIPRWATALGLSGGLVLVLFPSSVVAICIGLPAAMLSLQLGRMHAISSLAWRMELAAAGVLAVGIGVGFWAASVGSFGAVALIGAGAGLAVLLRAIGAPTRVDRRASWRYVKWVTAETAVVAAVPYLTTFVVLAFLGASDIVAFRLVLSTLGVLQPILGYLRTRSLNVHSPALVLATWCLSILALGSLVVLDILGVFSRIFGESWDFVSLPALAVACLWKLLTIPETVPFAALRRRGSVATVFFARLSSALTSIVLAFVASLVFRDLMSVFIAFSVAQALTVALYMVLERRDRDIGSIR